MLPILINANFISSMNALNRKYKKQKNVRGLSEEVW